MVEQQIEQKKKKSERFKSYLKRRWAATKKSYYTARKRRWAATKKSYYTARNRSEARVAKVLTSRPSSNITRATGSYTLKIAKLRLPKGYHNTIPERYDTIPMEYLKPSFIVPRYQQDLENEKLKQMKQLEQEELAAESEKGILNAKNVFKW